MEIEQAKPKTSPRPRKEMRGEMEKKWEERRGRENEEEGFDRNCSCGFIKIGQYFSSKMHISKINLLLIYVI